jgi:hypothetical protein
LDGGGDGAAGEEEGLALVRPRFGIRGVGRGHFDSMVELVGRSWSRRVFVGGCCLDGSGHPFNSNVSLSFRANQYMSWL